MKSLEPAIHRCLSKTKSIGSGSDPESQLYYECMYIGIYAVMFSKVKLPYPMWIVREMIISFNRLLSQKWANLMPWRVDKCITGLSVCAQLMLGLRGGLVVSVLDCQPRGSGFKSQPEQKF